jgi:hypothetical protein
MPNTEFQMYNSVRSLLECLVTQNVNVDPVLVNTSIFNTVNEKHTDISLIEESFTSSPNLQNWVRN